MAPYFVLHAVVGARTLAVVKDTLGKVVVAVGQKKQLRAERNAWHHGLRAGHAARRPQPSSPTLSSAPPAPTLAYVPSTARATKTKIRAGP